MNKWIQYLQKKHPEVYERLCQCCNTKSDLIILVNTRWAYLQHNGKDKEGFTKEDALVQVLEWLDSNNQFIDLTREEYDELKS